MSEPQIEPGTYYSYERLDSITELDGWYWVKRHEVDQEGGVSTEEIAYLPTKAHAQEYLIILVGLEGKLEPGHWYQLEEYFEEDEESE